MTQTFPPPSASSPYLRDESRFQGWADDVRCPHDHRALADLVGRGLEKGLGLTMQGARTGLCGAGVPQGGLLVSTAQLDRPLALEIGPGGLELEVQPGYSLAALRRDLARRRLDLAGPPPRPEALEALRAREHFWPPDPGETSATLGGLAATRASGPNAMRHGTAADHVLALTAILHDGSEHLIRRGRHRFDRRKLALPTGRILETDPGALGLSGQADLLDLLLGSQGTLGAITSLRLALSPAPAHVWGLVFFLGAEEMAAGLVESLAEDPPAAMVSLDFLDWASLQAVKGLRRSASKLADIPEPPLSAKAAVLVELNAPEEGPVEEASGKALASCQLSGGDPDESWALVGPELEKMRTFRHAVPEAIGGLLDLARAGGFPAVKLATDHSRPGLGFGRCLAEYRRDLREAGLEAVIFGHARDNLLHVNFLPRDRDEARRARELCGHFLGLARAAGGELFLEHGVGKIKRDLFLAHERPERIRALREVREALDPDGLLNPGNIFPAGPGQGGPGD